jgi:hypothetical protein
MKTKNDLKTGILIGIGMIVVPLIIMSSKPITSPHNISPESHVWKSSVTNDGRYYLHNTKTGEVRKYSRSYPSKTSDKNLMTYVKMSERE